MWSAGTPSAPRPAGSSSIICWRAQVIPGGGGGGQFTREVGGGEAPSFAGPVRFGAAEPGAVAEPGGGAFEFALARLLVRFSQLVVEQPRLKAIEIHPLMVLPPFAGAQGTTRVLALDARIVLHDPALAEHELPRPVIRPYPTQYVEPYTLQDGTPVIIRPIRPEDEALLIHFHEKLSEQSVYLRYFHALNLSQRIAHDRLARAVRANSVNIELRRTDHKIEMHQ